MHDLFSGSALAELLMNYNYGRMRGAMDAIMDLVGNDAFGLCNAEEPLVLSKKRPVEVPRYRDLLVGICTLEKHRKITVSLRIGGMEISRVDLWGDRGPSDPRGIPDSLVVLPIPSPIH